MDIIATLITVGLILAGLLILWAIIAAFFARRAKRAFDENVTRMRQMYQDSLVDEDLFPRGIHQRR